MQIAFGNAECCICVSFILRNMLLILWFSTSELDFRFLVGAPLHGIRAFLTTNQLKVVLTMPLPLPSSHHIFMP